MAYTLKGYSHFPFFLLKQLVSDLSDQENTVIKCALMKDTYTPDQDNDTVFSDVFTHEITGDDTLDPDDDYPAGGLIFAGLAAGASVSVTGRVTKVDFDDASEENVTFGGYSLVIYDATPADPDDQVLIAFCDFGGLKMSNDGTYMIQLNAAGLFTITVPA
jgi:hypothetical protein